MISWTARTRIGVATTLRACVLLLGVTMLLSGCGLWRRVTDGPEPSTEPTEQSEEPGPASEEPAEEASPPAEDTAETPPPEEDVEEEPAESPTPPASQEEGAIEEEDEPPEPSAESGPPEASESTDPTDPEGFVVDLPPEERAALQEQIRSDLTTAMEVLDAWGTVEGVSPEKSEQLQTIQDFVELSRAAVEEEDLLGAANLALKARILAQEIGRP